jgi:PAS domain S-box-containing protein
MTGESNPIAPDGSHEGTRGAPLARQPALIALAALLVAAALAVGLWISVHAMLSVVLESAPGHRAALVAAEVTVLSSGIAAALMLAGIVYVLARERRAGARAQSTLNEARMLGIVRSSMEAIITVDEAQRIVIFNPMAERVFRCTAADALGAQLSRFIPERFRAAHAKHVVLFGVTGVSERQMGLQRVLFGLRANGEEFPIEASISQIDDGTGKLYTVMLRDVTERVKADSALRSSREELRELSANLQNVREEEKSRIARELHDDLGQQLTALKMDLSIVEQAIGGQSAANAEIAEQLRGMRQLVDRTVASVRRIAADQRPVMLDDLGLLPAIDWLADDFTNRYGVEVERHFATGEVEFGPAAATALFRIVQEALTNVARHADATRVTLDIHIDADDCILRVADNGRGSCTPDARTGKSFGLIGMRERARMLGGSVSVETAEGRGFAVTVSLPMQAVQKGSHP